MPRSTTTYRIFVASPGDVHRERDAMLGVVNEMNRILEALLPDDGIRVELLRWETDVAPQIADGPQPVVNNQIESYDIFLGLFAKRFGTPTNVAGSGTEEEFRRAYETWRKHGAPWIVFYFNTKADPPKGIIGEYNGAELFTSTVLPRLLQIIGILVKEERQVQGALPARSAGSVSGQPVPIGKRVRISDIGEKDACYHRRIRHAFFRQRRQTLHFPAVSDCGGGRRD